MVIDSILYQEDALHTRVIHFFWKAVITVSRYQFSERLRIQIICESITNIRKQWFIEFIFFGHKVQKDTPTRYRYRIIWNDISTFRKWQHITGRIKKSVGVVYFKFIQIELTEWKQTVTKKPINRILIKKFCGVESIEHLHKLGTKLYSIILLLECLFFCLIDQF